MVRRSGIGLWCNDCQTYVVKLLFWDRDKLCPNDGTHELDLCKSDIISMFWFDPVKVSDHPLPMPSFTY